MTDNLKQFLLHSNMIEGYDIVTESELFAAGEYIAARTTKALLDYVYATAGAKAVLRKMPYQNVRVGDHVAPRGGDAVVTAFEMLHDAAIEQIGDERAAHRIHMEYLTLHPLMDGNGRSARLIYYVMMRENVRPNFLQRYYYDTLRFCGDRA